MITKQELPQTKKVSKHITKEPTRVLNKRSGDIITLKAGFDLRKLNKHVFEVLENE